MTGFTIEPLHFSGGTPSVPTEGLLDAFATVKPDSIVSRLPRLDVLPYLGGVIADGGHVLVAMKTGRPIGFLIYVRDNNYTLDFLKSRKFNLLRHLALSSSLSDKVLLIQSALNVLLLRNQTLGQAFLNEISLLAVADGVRGQGVGKALIRALGPLVDGDINVKTDKANLPAVSFYQAVGFRQYGEVTVGLRTLVCLVLSAR